MSETALKLVQKFFPEVTSVKDATEPVVVEVTKAHNRDSRVKSHKSCAMAVACKQKLAADGVIVSVKVCYVIYNRRAVRYQLPETVSREIVSFDREAGFAPGEYRLSPPVPSQKLGARERSPEKTGEKTPSTKKIKAHHTSGIRTALGSSAE